MLFRGNGEGGGCFENHVILRGSYGFQGKRSRGISHPKQSIKGGGQEIDCQLTANEEGI